MKGKIFNAQEVQAILNGSKVMFREVIKNANYDSPVHSYKDWENNGLYYPVATLVDEDSAQTETQYSFNAVKSPYQVGQKIFCKETFCEVEVGAGVGYNSGKQTLYKAVDDYDVKWKPAQHMKQEHSRLTLRIKSVKVERLQDISEEDAVKEGFLNDNFGDRAEQPPSMKFRDYWNATHKKPEEKWEVSPWVFAYSYEVIKNG